MGLHATIQKNIVIGEKNTLRVLIAFMLCEWPDAIEDVRASLAAQDEEQLYNIAGLHSRYLGCSPQTIRNHITKILDGKVDDILWPTAPRGAGDEDTSEG